jgi:hypothetical protein
MLKIQMDLTPDIIQDIKHLFSMQEYKFSEIKAPVISGGVTPEQVTTRLMQTRPIEEPEMIKTLKTPKGLIKVGDVVVYNTTNNTAYIGTVNNFIDNKIYIADSILISILQGIKVSRGTIYSCSKDDIGTVIPKTNDQTPKN